MEVYSWEKTKILSKRHLLVHVVNVAVLAWRNVRYVMEKATITTKYVIIAMAKDMWSVLNVREKVKPLIIMDKW
jgi:hypothetical protein